jgi:hypothetical protein
MYFCRVFVVLCMMLIIGSLYGETNPRQSDSIKTISESHVLDKQDHQESIWTTCRQHLENNWTKYLGITVVAVGAYYLTYEYNKINKNSNEKNLKPQDNMEDSIKCTEDELWELQNLFDINNNLSEYKTSLKEKKKILINELDELKSHPNWETGSDQKKQEEFVANNIKDRLSDTNLTGYFGQRDLLDDDKKSIYDEVIKDLKEKYKCD